MTLDTKQQMRLHVLHTKLCTVAEMAEDLQMDEKTILQALSDMRLKPLFERDKPEKSQFFTTQKIDNIKTTRNSTFTPEIKKQIVELNKAGVPAKEIGKKLGFTGKQISSQLWIIRNAEHKANEAEKQTATAEESKTTAPSPAPIIDNTVDNIISMPGAMCLLLKFIKDKYTENVTECSASNKDGIAYAEFEFEGTVYAASIAVVKREPASAATDTSSDVNISPKV